MKRYTPLLLLVLAGPVLAEDPAPQAAPAGKDANTLSTNVVGSQEAPTVLNVVPWKDKQVKLEKKNPTTSILNQVLQPLDRDVLRREVQYYRSLQEQSAQ
jgi:hypothetical protein